MFSGIVETIGTVEKIEKDGSNIHFTIKSSLAKESYIDQSIAHNGVCLTVVSQTDDDYIVTAIQETLDKSNLGALSKGDLVNLERCIKMDSFLDGHMVQGHVDSTARCTKVEELDGSWYFSFEYDPEFSSLLVEKGSVAINGTSLTVINPHKNQFKVAIIPYTYEHTNFKTLKAGDLVNIEFDIIGKYVQRFLDARKGK